MKRSPKTLIPNSGIHLSTLNNFHASGGIRLRLLFTTNLSDIIRDPPTLLQWSDKVLLPLLLCLACTWKQTCHKYAHRPWTVLILNSFCELKSPTTLLYYYMIGYGSMDLPDRMILVLIKSPAVYLKALWCSSVTQQKHRWWLHLCSNSSRACSYPWLV